MRFIEDELISLVVMLSIFSMIYCSHIVFTIHNLPKANWTLWLYVLFTIPSFDNYESGCILRKKKNVPRRKGIARVKWLNVHSIPTIGRKFKILFDFAQASVHCILISIYLCVIFASKLRPCLEAQLQGTTQDHLQIFNIEMKAKMKSYQMPEQVTVTYNYRSTVKWWLIMRTLLIIVGCPHCMCRWSFGNGLPQSCWVLWLKPLYTIGQLKVRKW